MEFPLWFKIGAAALFAVWSVCVYLSCTALWLIHSRLGRIESLLAGRPARDEPA